MQKIYISLKSGNPVTIVPNSQCKIKWTTNMTPVSAVSVKRIDCDKEMLTPLSGLQPLEDFLKDGGELCSSHLRLIEIMQKGH